MAVMLRDAGVPVARRARLHAPGAGRQRQLHRHDHRRARLGRGVLPGRRLGAVRPDADRRPRRRQPERHRLRAARLPDDRRRRFGDRPRRAARPRPAPTYPTPTPAPTPVAAASTRLRRRQARVAVGRRSVSCVIALLGLTPAGVRAGAAPTARSCAARDGDPDPLWAELSDTAVDLGYVWSPARSPRQVAGWLARDTARAGRAAEPRAGGRAAPLRAGTHQRPEPAMLRHSSETCKKVVGRLRSGRRLRVRLRALLWPASLRLGRDRLGRLGAGCVRARRPTGRATTDRARRAAARRRDLRWTRRDTADVSSIERQVLDGSALDGQFSSKRRRRRSSIRLRRPPWRGGGGLAAAAAVGVAGALVAAADDLDARSRTSRRRARNRRRSAR